MTSESIENELNNGVLTSLYLFYGEETYLIDTCVKKIKKLFGKRQTRNKLYKFR